MSSLHKIYSSVAGQPLWLPKGSIRAIIALMVVGTWVFLLGTTREVSKEFYVVLGCVVTFYFQARENDRERELEKHRLEELTKAVFSSSGGPVSELEDVG